MQRQTISWAGVALGIIALAQSPAAAAPKAVDNPNGCKVVERQGGAPPGSVTSSVTAGGGHVSASTGGGTGVTVYSGSGNGVAAAGTASDGTTSTTVTSGNGDCTIYVDPGSKK
jgi:hypothetical protein